ncbi:TadE/TadG family type IV pilus assembly protein [Methylobacterium durans]|uniref:Pilus assembly protein TadE n=1 Tax=Methylobacterium durans TaxID=2202825 RepID=A0A2U8WEK1_9HYPH|nr:pilus assembly protein TadE [Methylobacterium durans]
MLRADRRLSRQIVRAHCCRGTAAVEFALIMPVLVALIAAILTFGLYLGALHTLRQIAGEAARASIAGITDQERRDLARERVNTALAHGAIFAPGSVDVTVGFDTADPSLYAVTLRFDTRRLGLTGLARIVSIPQNLVSSTVTVRRGGL